MAENLATQIKSREIETPAPQEVEIDRELLKLFSRFLKDINEIKDYEIWTPSKEDVEQKVIFKATINGMRYTLLSSHTSTEPKADSTSLSPREQEIVRLASRGMSNKTIAAVLDISPWTVSTYVRRIFSKLSVNSRVQMVAVVTKSGVLESKAPQTDEIDYENPAVLEFQKLISSLMVVAR